MKPESFLGNCFPAVSLDGEYLGSYEASGLGTVFAPLSHYFTTDININTSSVEWVVLQLPHFPFCMAASSLLPCHITLFTSFEPWLSFRHLKLLPLFYVSQIPKPSLSISFHNLMSIDLFFSTLVIHAHSQNLSHNY